MSWLVFGILLLTAALLLAQAVVRVSPQTLARLVRYLGAAILVIVALPIAWRGGLALAALFLAVAAAMGLGRPIRGMLGAGGGLFGAGPAPGIVSEIDTDLVHVTLDHDSGAMDGTVRRGPFEGFRLSALSIDQLTELLRSSRREDPDAAALIETYLTRHRGEEFAQAEKAGSRAAAAPSGPMTRSEALAVLGLEDGASHDAVIAAHRQLMKKLHPDRGGSTYLASKINQAKETLLH